MRKCLVAREKTVAVGEKEGVKTLTLKRVSFKGKRKDRKAGRKKREKKKTL